MAKIINFKKIPVVEIKVQVFILFKAIKVLVKGDSK